jgi:hypothetical protein
MDTILFPATNYQVFRSDDEYWVSANEDFIVLKTKSMMQLSMHKGTRYFSGLNGGHQWLRGQPGHL